MSSISKQVTSVLNTYMKTRQHEHVTLNRKNNKTKPITLSKSIPQLKTILATQKITRLVSNGRQMKWDFDTKNGQNWVCGQD